MIIPFNLLNSSITLFNDHAENMDRAHSPFYAHETVMFLNFFCFISAAGNTLK